MVWKEIPILIVEDDPTHRFMFRATLEESGIGNRILEASDGDEALDCVFGRGKFAERTRDDIPGLILLDLKMPRVDGFEVLAALKSNEETKHIPVIVVTTSSAQSDINRSYALGANAFVTKPLRMMELTEKLKTLRLFWLIVAELPDPSPQG